MAEKTKYEERLNEVKPCKNIPWWGNSLEARMSTTSLSPKYGKSRLSPESHSSSISMCKDAHLPCACLHASPYSLQRAVPSASQPAQPQPGEHRESEVSRGGMDTVHVSTACQELHRHHLTHPATTISRRGN